MNHGFQFGDKGTWDFSMRIEKFPMVTGTTRKRTTTSVAGRNGDLHYIEDAFTNFQQAYECYFHGDYSSQEIAHAIKAWLYGDGAYRRLSDTYDPDHFHLAAYVGPLNIQNHLNKYGRCTVTFDCDPRAFLRSGEKTITFTQSGALYNPTGFNAKPMITVYGTGAGNVTVGDATVEIKELTDLIILDCETQNAYRQAGDGGSESKNGSIYAPEFPKLTPGTNAAHFTGGITKIEIIPRWWEL